MMYLLDTNVISKMRRVRLGRGDLAVEAWTNRVNASDLYLSAISIKELEIGVLLAERRDPSQGAILRMWLDGYVLPAFADRILPIDTSIALRSAKFRVPDPHPVRDGLIAAMALLYGMTVVTRNTIHFESTGVAVLNPWQA
jgi:toxin FitB